VKYPTLSLGLLSLTILGTPIQTCFAATIQLDLSGLMWNALTQGQYFDLQLKTPNQNVSYSLNLTEGSTSLNPTVAANYAAVERKLVIDLSGNQSYEQLEIQADFQFFNGTAYAQISTFGINPVPDLSGPPADALQTYWSNVTMPGRPVFGALALQVDHFQFDFLPPPVTPPVIENIGPIIAAGGPPSGPQFSPPSFDPAPGLPGFDPLAGLETPEPATLGLFGTGLMLLGLRRRRFMGRPR